ncbi:peptidase MA family metallohydrolase [Nocardia sp. NPDC056064]|uniref:peptidase MA family metallohydrolase n=1 Tax=Nocardia sp. NPDC056064 TaxID=3345701 RepID=UPI0035E13943
MTEPSRRPSGLRSWFSANGRLEFCLTLASITLLTGACVALVLVPRNAGPLQLATDEAEVLDTTEGIDDPRLTPVRRDLQPFGPILVRRVAVEGSPDALLVAHDGHRADLATLEQDLAPAIDAVSSVWGTDWNRAPVIVVAGTPAEFTALTRSAGTPAAADVAAVSLTGSYPPGTRPTDQRIVFNPDARRRVGDEGLATLLRHELTHVATRAATGDGAPQWLLEGYAEFVAQRDRGATFSQIAPTLTTRLRANTLPTDLLADAAFTGTDAAYAYEAAWSTCAFLADRFGADRLTTLYQRLAGGPQSAAAQDAAFTAVLGISRAELLDGWRAWLRARAV